MTSRVIHGINLKYRNIKNLFVVLALAGVMTACNNSKEKKADGMNDKMEEKMDGKTEEVKDTMAKKMDESKSKM